MKHLLWVFALIMVAGCAKSYRAESPASMYGGEGKMYAAQERMQSESMNREYRRASPTTASVAYPPSPGRGGGARGMDGEADMVEEMEAPDDAGGSAEPSADPPPKPDTPQTPQLRRMIIYAARLAIQVMEPEKSLEEALELAKKLGGFLSSRQDLFVELRIPAAQFFDFVQEMEKMGVVTERVISSEDVTEQFRDLTIRLENLQVMQKRLMDLLELAKTVEERLKIERELSRINGEIDAISVRLRMLRNLVDFATVQLRFIPRHPGGPVQPQKLPTPVWWVHSFSVDRLFHSR